MRPQIITWIKYWTGSNRVNIFLLMHNLHSKYREILEVLKFYEWTISLALNSTFLQSCRASVLKWFAINMENGIQ